ncbi:MAG: ABC transporter ATP-binding protein [Syntrophomonadaceae bacterium]|nr:ABC transporter ATP-binding protein [Syntrophomonadaceae bacterium]
MHLLELNDAGFTYPQQRDAVFSSINLRVDRGEIFCLLGPNGCGKTTLLDCILGIHRLDQGRIKVNGEDARHFRPGEIAKHVAYVPQRHENTFPYTVIDMVKMGRAVYTGRFSSPSDIDKEQAKKALEIVGMMHMRHRPFTQLSGGEAQLVMIARALAQQTSLIIMDEPTAHLDFKHEMLVMETIVKLVRETDMSVLMATHFPNHTFYFENRDIPIRVALMHDHTFLESGKPTEVLREDNIGRIYRVKARLAEFAMEEGSLRQLIPLRTLTAEDNCDESQY